MYHWDALHTLFGITPGINKALRESSFTQGTIDGVSGGDSPAFHIAAVIPIGCV